MKKMTKEARSPATGCRCAVCATSAGLRVLQRVVPGGAVVAAAAVTSSGVLLGVSEAVRASTVARG